MSFGLSDIRSMKSWLEVLIGSLDEDSLSVCEAKSRLFAAGSKVMPKELGCKLLTRKLTSLDWLNCSQLETRLADGVERHT